MGCGGSRLGGVATARANESGVVPIPAGIRPLLKRRLEEMKKLSHARVLKGNHTSSKKELLHHGSSDDGEETEENDDKVAPAPEHHVEEKKEIIYEKILSRDDVKEVKEEEEEEEKHHDDEAINVKKEENDSIHDDDHHHEAINVKKDGDNGINHNDNDEGRMSDYDERMLFHGSPSFRVYCMDLASDDDDEGKDGEDTRISVETESVITEPKEDEIIVKKERRERKGKRFGITLPRKYLASVTAPCYAGAGGCMGNSHSRLVQAKSSQ